MISWRRGSGQKPSRFLSVAAKYQVLETSMFLWKMSSFHRTGCFHVGEATIVQTKPLISYIPRPGAFDGKANDL